MRLTPINLAEAVIEPFWDPMMSGFPQWSVADGSAHGLRVAQQWCWVEFEWTSRPTEGRGLRMERFCDVDCSDYDDLLVSASLPPGAVLKMTADTDCGEAGGISAPFGSCKKEVALDLRGARRISKITLEVLVEMDGMVSGWFNWIGLKNRALLERSERQWHRFDTQWEGYLKPGDYSPSFQPSLGVYVSGEDLDAVRARFIAGQPNPFLDAAMAAARHPPEKSVGEYVNFWGDTRFNRVRDHGKLLLTHGANAAVAGVLLRDKGLLRLAARYALSLGHCEHWADGFVCRFPGSQFEHRCFVQSLCAFDVALILDLAGEMFTDLGKEFLMRRLAEEALGTIAYNSWRYEYIHHCNQLVWFMPGRILALLALEKSWPRIRPHTELAIAELGASLENTILPDGGYVEGPSYFLCVGNSACLALYLHARARGLKPEEAVSAEVRRCGAFGEVLFSTDVGQDVIPVCDSFPHHDLLSQAMLATMMPGSAWARMFARRLPTGSLPAFSSSSNTGLSSMSHALLTMIIGEKARATPPPPVSLVVLPDLGWAASTRLLHGMSVKLFLMGNKAGAGHTHEDKGSFVLEYAGETFAMDLGTCDYSSPFCLAASTCQQHNMLVPVVEGERPCPKSPLPYDVKPECRGDATRFSATLDATPGWEGYYRKWQRTWDSPTPDVLTITDDYELERGSGVDFFWITEREVRIEEHLITLCGTAGSVTLRPEASCTVIVEDLPFLRGVGGDGKIVTLRRIILRKSGTRGRLTTLVRLSPTLDKPVPSLK